MNELFVNIKVDREERPDIDQIYMSALHLIGEQGGWPLTMFLTPAGEPVWGGTYFPKTARYGRAAFTDVLREVARVFREDPDRIDQSRRSLIGRLSERARPAGKVVIGRAELDSIAGRFARLIDRTNGGLQGAPKFPQCSVLELLWRTGQRAGEATYFELVELTLDRICQGGIYDHLGGGFSRYSVDERWLVPLRKDAVRQRAAARAVGACPRQHPSCAIRDPCTRDGRMAGARNDDAPRRLLRLPRCRLRR
jgi:uncharacterized protein